MATEAEEPIETRRVQPRTKTVRTETPNTTTRAGSSTLNLTLLGMGLVFFGLSVKHHWWSRLATWAGNPPQAASTSSSASTALVPGIGGLNDWQAAIILTIILVGLTETPAAPLSPVIALAYGIVELGSGLAGLKTEYPSLFGGTNALGQSTTTVPPLTNSQLQNAAQTTSNGGVTPIPGSI